MISLIKKFKKTLREVDGRTLLWFHHHYLAQIRYNYFIFQINGHKDTIDKDIINAIKEYMDNKQSEK